MNILGLWDGHDAGAALLKDGVLVSAVNEERFTRRKLEVGFPAQSIAACLAAGALAPADVDVVSATTSDVAKTLGRIAPWTKEQYYLVRRRKAAPGLLSSFTRRAKYRMTTWPPNRLTQAWSRALIERALRPLGFRGPRVDLVDHHEGHACTAAYGSGFDSCAVLTI